MALSLHNTFDARSTWHVYEVSFNCNTRDDLAFRDWFKALSGLGDLEAKAGECPIPAFSECLSPFTTPLVPFHHSADLIGLHPHPHAHRHPPFLRLSLPLPPTRLIGKEKKNNKQ